MTVTNIVGVDVSKATLDCHLYCQNQSLCAVPNTEKGFRQIAKWLKAHHSKKALAELLVVIEATGYYSHSFEHYLFQRKFVFVKCSALEIKLSRGLQRGKTDKGDARFIARYGWMKKDELIPMKPVPIEVIQLQQLMNFRDRLVMDRASYQGRMKNITDQMKLYNHTDLRASSDTVIRTLKLEVRHIEGVILRYLQGHTDFWKTYQLLTSIVGVGFASAVHFIIATENFTKFSNARKLVCYCGVAPFPYESGSSIRQRARTSVFANKKLKSLLSQGALSALQVDPAFKRKFDQKIKEGKHKLSVLNILRAKLIYRMFAVIKRGTPFQSEVPKTGRQKGAGTDLWTGSWPPSGVTSQ